MIMKQSRNPTVTTAVIVDATAGAVRVPGFDVSTEPAVDMNKVTCMPKSVDGNEYVESNRVCRYGLQWEYCSNQRYDPVGHFFSKSTVKSQKPVQL